MTYYVDFNNIQSKKIVQGEFLDTDNDNFELLILSFE